MHLIPPSHNVLSSDCCTPIGNKFANLDANVSEAGDNFSMGCIHFHIFRAIGTKYLRREKQLLCMARALLKRAKILIMDEVRPCVAACRRLFSNVYLHPYGRPLQGDDHFFAIGCVPSNVIDSVDYATDEHIGNVIRE